MTAVPATGEARGGVPPLVWWLLGLIAFGALAFAPGFLDLYWIRVLTNVWLFAIVAQGINIIAGFVGYPAFGNVVFFGLGAYGAAIGVGKFQLPFFASLLAGMLLCATVAMIAGPPLLRLRGHYFAIATLGLNEAIKAVVNNLTDLTGGGMGLSLPLPTGSVGATAAYFYRAYLTLATAGLVIAALLRTTRFGYALRAIRANEEGAESLGIDTTFYKSAAWLISALLTGCAGALYAQWLAYIEPSVVFDITIAVKGFVMFLIGGPATIFGPLVGAVLIEIVATLAWSNLLKYHLAFLGIIIMATAIAMPLGIHVFLRERIAQVLRLLRVRA